MDSTVSSTFYMAGKPAAGSSSLLPFSKLPKVGQQLGGGYIVLEPPDDFLGVMAANTRNPEHRYVLQRAQGRLVHATRDEVRLYFTLPAHPNVCVPVDVLDGRGVPLVASPYEPEGTLKAWLRRRVDVGTVCWSFGPPVIRALRSSGTKRRAKNPYAVIGFAPLWGPHTLRPQKYKAPVGKGVVMASLRRPASPPMPKIVSASPTSALPSRSPSPIEGRTSPTPSSPPPPPPPPPGSGEPMVFEEEIVVRLRIALHIARGLAHLHGHRLPQERNVEGADNAEEGRKKGGDSVLLHLDLNPMNVLITRWSVPRLAHPRATRPQVHYFGAKIKDHRAISTTRILYSSPGVIRGEAANVSIIQPVPGKPLLEAAAVFDETGVELKTRFTIEPLLQAGTVTGPSIIRLAVWALEEAHDTRAAKLAQGAGEGSTVALPGGSLEEASPSRPSSPSLPSLLRPSTGKPSTRKDDAGAVGEHLIAGGRTLSPWPDFAPPEQEALVPHEFLMRKPTFPGLPPPFVADSLNDKCDVFPFGLLLAYLFSGGAPRAMNPQQAINGLKFDMEPAEDYVNRVLPPAILALSRPLECVRDLALHCVNERPSCRPSAALAATLLESALTLAGVEVDPKLPGPDVTPIPASQQLFNEAKYYMFAREDWPVAAELLRHLLPDGNKGLPKGIDWPPLMKLLRTIKDGLIRSGEDTWDSFPYYRIALQVRGVPQCLRLNLYPIHDLCRWGFTAELSALLAGVGDILAPAALRIEMDKYWKDDLVYVKALRNLALVYGRVSYVSLLCGEEDGDGETPLRIACRAGHVQAVVVLLKHKADPFAVSKRFGESALHCAASSGSVEMLTALLECGLDPETPTLSGSYPLHIASAGGHAAAVKTLLQWGASAEVMDAHQRRPIHIATSLGHVDVVKALLSYGCSVTEPGPRQNGVRLNPKVKESVFDTAVRTKRLELIHLLDDATRKQTTCGLSSCGKRLKGAQTKSSMRCALCRSVWWCSPACQSLDVAHKGCSGEVLEDDPPVPMWPQRGVVTQWGTGVLLGPSSVRVSGEREEPVLVNKKGKPKPTSPTKSRAAVKGGNDVVTSALVVIPRAFSPPIRLNLRPSSLRVCLGLCDPPAPRHYDLSLLKPVMRYPYPPGSGPIVDTSDPSAMPAARMAAAAFMGKPLAAPKKRTLALSPIRGKAQLVDGNSGHPSNQIEEQQASPSSSLVSRFKTVLSKPKLLA